MENTKIKYTPPTLTTVSFVVEQGFQSSSEQRTVFNILYYNALESYNTKDGWGETDNHFFD